MASHGMFYGWNRPIPGREAQAGEVFTQSMAYWTKLKQQGVIESFEPALLERHGGDLNGFILVRGDRDKLQAMMATEEYQQLMLRVDHLVGGFGEVRVMLGDELMRRMATWMQLVATTK